MRLTIALAVATAGAPPLARLGSVRLDTVATGGRLHDDLPAVYRATTMRIRDRGKKPVPSAGWYAAAAVAVLAVSAGLAIAVLPHPGRPARAQADSPTLGAARAPVGRIYYVDERRGNIVRVRPNSRGRRDLTARHQGGGSAHFPSPSPNGRLVVFSRYPGRRGWRAGERGNLVVMRPDGSRPRVLTRTQTIDERTPAFTANGRALLYAAEVREGRYEIFRRPLRGGRSVRLTNLDRGVTEDPVAALNGRQLAFQTLDATRLALARPDGRGLIELTERMNPSCPDDCPVEEDPAFSPDSRLLAFASTRSGSAEIWVARIDGSSARQLTRLGDAVEPSWSPDGRHVAFERLGQGIWTVRRDGRGLRRVVANSSATFPRWGR
jgi:TolB protein